MKIGGKFMAMHNFDALIEEALNNSPDMTMAIARLHRADAFTQIVNA